MRPRCRSCFQWTVLVLRDARMGQRRRQMCRNIKTLFNFEPPATEDEIHASALQFVRKLSGFNKPSQANAEPFDRRVPVIVPVSRFFTAPFLANSIPHTVQGICGNRFQTPFASPSGVGESSAIVNVIWGLANFAIGSVLLYAFFPGGISTAVAAMDSRLDRSVGDGAVARQPFWQGTKFRAASLKRRDGGRRKRRRERCSRMSIRSRGDGPGQSVLQQRQCALGGNRFSKQVTLSLRASICLEICELLGVFDALSGRRQTEAACEPENGTDDHHAFIVFADAVHKAAVDLDLVEMQRLQLPERRIAGAEIIESDSNPGLP